MPGLNDPLNWQASTLDTPGGPLTFWVLADWDSYYEQYENENNQTRILIAVPWLDATQFKRFALGFAERATATGGGTAAYLNRVTPLRCPWQEGQYLKSLKKHKVVAGTNTDGSPAFHVVDELTDNWPTFPYVEGMPARIIYEALFTCPDYDVIPQREFRDNGYKELARFVSRSQKMNPREKKTPSCAYETDEDTPVIVPEVGFLPYLDWEFMLTWRAVPAHLVPEAAIADCVLKLNNAVFDYPPSSADPFRLTRLTSYNRFLVGDLLFKGLATETKPSRGPNGEWLRDLPYVFGFQPGDGSGDGMQSVPRNDGSWIKVRVKGTAGAPQYLYQYANFEALFQPEP